MINSSDAMRQNIQQNEHLILYNDRMKLMYLLTSLTILLRVLSWLIMDIGCVTLTVKPSTPLHPINHQNWKRRHRKRHDSVYKNLVEVSDRTDKDTTNYYRPFETHLLQIKKTPHKCGVSLWCLSQLDVAFGHFRRNSVSLPNGKCHNSECWVLGCTSHLTTVRHKQILRSCLSPFIHHTISCIR